MAVLPHQLGGLADALVMRDSGAQLLSAVGNNWYNKQYNNDNNCAGGVVSGGGAQSELTCNGGGGVVFPSRKRGRDEFGLEQLVSSSSALLPLPVPGTLIKEAVDVGPVTASTSGRVAENSSVADVLVAEMCRQEAEVDAVVRAEFDRMRAGLEQARKQQRQALARAVAGAAARRLREKEAELGAARCRNAELEERLRQAAAESQAWCGVARGHEAVAAGLRATLDHLLLRGGAGGEGSGESAADDAQSCCFVEARDVDVAATATSSPATRWACKACGDGEATVLLLPCRHLCLCKSCEPRMDFCPACLAVKNASIHVAES
ncbi:hypothetical protein QOZ80_9BG0712590 [Eleusine coracana subsp. coracana]|nr:hypothetical protein QOZ80_9BG0712590 [Eleusine coracana subsp. coracana]